MGLHNQTGFWLFLAMRAFVRFWAFIGFALTLFGIFWLPKDIQDWEDAAQPWKRVFAMVDQNTALWIFSVVLIIYLAMVDVAPRIFRLFSKDRATLFLDKPRIDKLSKEKVCPTEIRVFVTNFGSKAIRNLRIRADRVGEKISLSDGQDSLAIYRFYNFQDAPVYLGPQESYYFTCAGIDNEDRFNNVYIGPFSNSEKYRTVLYDELMFIRFSVFDDDIYCGAGIIKIEFNKENKYLSLECRPTIKKEGYLSGSSASVDPLYYKKQRTRRQTRTRR